MTDKKIVLTTAGTKEEAQDIAWALLERKLAACVNMVAVESVYKWKDEVESNTEYMLVIKTTEAAYDQVLATIQEINTYDVPECVQIPIEGGSEKYLQWIADCVAPEKTD
jgi:periplasmic divalent cation tolerance protein